MLWSNIRYIHVYDCFSTELIFYHYEMPLFLVTPLTLNSTLNSTLSDINIVWGFFIILVFNLY